VGTKGHPAKIDEDLKRTKGSTFPWKAQLNCRAHYHTGLRKSNYKGLKIH